MSVDSVVEDDIVLVPWVGNTSSKNCLSIIVLSSNVNLIEKICDALTELHAKGSQRWQMILLRATSLEQVSKETNTTGEVSIDFVILALDTNKVHCIGWAKKVLMEVHPDLRRRRVLLVNASGLPVNSMAVTAKELLSLQDEFNLDLLSANVNMHEDASFLALRLLKHLEVTVGVSSGIPNLNILQ